MNPMSRTLTCRKAGSLALAWLAMATTVSCTPTPAPGTAGDSAVTATAAAPIDDASVTATIRDLEEQLRQGIVAADTVALAALWASEYLSTSAVGHTSNRAESLVAYGTGLVKVASAEVRDLDVRTYGNTAVSLGMLDWSGAAAGRPFSGTARFQHVWVMRDGNWQLVASQLTNQPPFGAAPGRRP